MSVRRESDADAMEEALRGAPPLPAAESVLADAEGALAMCVRHLRSLDANVRVLPRRVRAGIAEAISRAEMAQERCRAARGCDGPA